VSSVNPLKTILIHRKAKLIHEYDIMSPEMQLEASASVKRLRLMVSGSAALPGT